MRISKQALIDVIDKAHADHDAASAKWETARKKWDTERRKKWEAESLPRWKSVRDSLSESIRNKSTISFDDIRSAAGTSPSRYGNVLDDISWTERTSPPNRLDGVVKPSSLPHYLPSLRAALVAIAEDVITDGQLRSLGYKGLESLFQAATVNGGAK